MEGRLEEVSKEQIRSHVQFLNGSLGTKDVFIVEKIIEQEIFIQEQRFRKL